MRNLAKSFVQAETAFDYIMPPSRRGNANLYVRSNRTAFGGGYHNGSVNKAIDAFNRARDMAALIRTVANDTTDLTGRYRKFNTFAYERHGTVEFRQHNGTLDGDKATNWIRLCVGFVQRSKDSRPRHRPSTKEHNPREELRNLHRKTSTAWCSWGSAHAAPR